jgi:hypothetical protein
MINDTLLKPLDGVLSRCAADQGIRHETQK